MTYDTVERLRTLVGARRAEILQAVETSPEGITAAELSQRLDIHINTVREHLRVLTDANLVSAEPVRSGRGRPRLVHRAVPGSAPERDGSLAGFQVLAEALVEALVATSDTPLVAALEAGRSWGTRRAAEWSVGGDAVPESEQMLEALVELLSELGFSPEETAPGEVVELHHCPFAELARRNPGVVCGIHLGVVQGFLQESRSTVVPTGLEPFAGHSLCRLRLRDPLALHAPEGSERRPDRV